jgi:uncharacterized protein (TIGR00251 family)
MTEPEPAPWIQTHGDALRLTIHLQPRASRSEVTGLHGDALRIRVAAPPVDGEANRELLRFLAAKLGTSPSALQLVHGTTGRRKLVEVRGIGRADVISRLGWSQPPA